ncbi:MAG: type II toxin-antitoxin system VapB family antitoxin [Dongiaceae bacterium]
MSLNIKDREAHELARQLAKETGETMTRAVVEALRERLARKRRHRKASATAKELLDIGQRCAAALKGTAPDHGAMLYDERGLPR